MDGNILVAFYAQKAGNQLMETYVMLFLPCHFPDYPARGGCRPGQYQFKSRHAQSQSGPFDELYQDADPISSRAHFRMQFMGKLESSGRAGEQAVFSKRGGGRAAALSSGSILPPGISQFSGMAIDSLRCAARMRPFCSMMAQETSMCGCIFFIAIMIRLAAG